MKKANIPEQPRDPRRVRVVWIGYLIILAVSIPWYVPEGSFRPLVFGLPYWTIISLIASGLFACWTAFVIARYWGEARGK